MRFKKSKSKYKFGLRACLTIKYLKETLSDWIIEEKAPTKKSNVRKYIFSREEEYVDKK